MTLPNSHAVGLGDVDHSRSITEADVASEQSYLHRLYDRLEELRANAVEARRDMVRWHVGSAQARSERESYERLYTREIAEYDAANTGLCFGRVDFEDEVRYIGRVGLRDSDMESTSLLFDWRAPLSRPFYLATAARPEGALRRRYFRAIGRRLTGVYEEALSEDAVTHDVSSKADIVGEAALLSALDDARTEHMSDIVATIQREQDTIIRHPHRGVMVVQGGPGTGKTAVALHRIAYVLYTYRQQLERSGVLIIGPNPTFLNYISRVLPSLGESGVVLRTFADLYPGVHALAEDSLRAVEVKGSLAMPEILTNAVRNSQALLEKDVEITLDGTRIAITSAMTKRARGRARSSRRAHNRAREIFVGLLIDQLVDSYISILGADTETGESLLSIDDRAEITAEMGEHPKVAAVIEFCWPALTPTALLSSFLSSRELISQAAGDYVDEDQDALYRVEGDKFSPADVPLLDELAEILGDDSERSKREADRQWKEQLRQAQEALDILTGSASPDLEDELDPEILMAYDVVDAETLARRHVTTSYLSVADRAAADRTWTFGHVVVDEGQEVSAMGWRMVMRRSPNRWMTVVGDLSQTSSPAGADSWAQALAAYVEERWVATELTVNYRTPAPIAAVSTTVLHRIDPHATAPTAIRKGGNAPTRSIVAAEDIAPTVADIAETVDPHRSVAVIAPPSLHEQLRSQLAWGESDPQRVIASVAQIKGLEFDSVIVVEPAEIEGQSPQGLQDLYVALTRATQTLDIVASNALPDSMTEVTVARNFRT